MKKKILIVVVILIVLCGGYYTIHEVSYNKTVARYGEGFEQNDFGDYCKNMNGQIVMIAKPSLFTWYTNISINDGTNSALIWVDLLSDDKSNEEYGIHLEYKGEMYEVYTDSDFKALDSSEQKILDKNANVVNKIRETYLKLKQGK